MPCPTARAISPTACFFECRMRESPRAQLRCWSPSIGTICPEIGWAAARPERFGRRSIPQHRMQETRRGVRAALEQALDAIAIHTAGKNGIDADVVLAEFHRQRFGEADQAPLHGRVGTAVRIAEAPVRSTFKTCSHSSGSTSWTGAVGPEIPALLMRTSMPPSLLAASATMLSICCRSPTSHCPVLRPFSRRRRLPVQQRRCRMCTHRCRSRGMPRPCACRCPSGREHPLRSGDRSPASTSSPRTGRASQRRVGPGPGNRFGTHQSGAHRVLAREGRDQVRLTAAAIDAASG
jgi:hypothetical protein